MIFLTTTLASAAELFEPEPWYPIVACKRSASADPVIADGDRGYDVISYNLDLRIDPNEETIHGTVTMTCDLTQAGLDSLRLDLVSNLTVSQVLWNNDVHPYHHQNDRLVLPIPDGPTSGLKIAITYGGEPQRHGQLYMGLVFRDRGPSPLDPLGRIVFNISEPSSSHSWWPCKDHPGDKALIRMRLTVPDTLQAVANGILISDEPVAPDWHRVTWSSDYPMPPYLVGISIGAFVEDEWPCETAAGTLPLTTHMYPEIAAAAVEFFAPTCDMLNFLEDLATPWPFPDERYGQMAIKWPGAMEHQTSTSFGNVLINGSGQYQNVILHELAHQWFGDAMTPSEWHDIWLNEGFARYCEALWIEYTEGHAAYLDFMHFIGPRRHKYLFTDKRPLTDPSPILSLLVYDKGAWVLHMLRAELGDAAFFEFFADYAVTGGMGHVESSDVIAAASRVAGRDMTSWFRPWLETSAAPSLTWHVRREGGADNPRHILTVLQLQTELFELRVPLLVIAAGDTTALTVNLHTSSAVIDLGPIEPKVIIEPRAPLLAWIQQQAPPIVLDIISAHPNPSADGQVELQFHIQKAGPLALSLHDARGRRLAHWDLEPANGFDEVKIWHWNGKNNRGEVLPSGVYWFVLDSGSERTIERITLIR